MAVISNGTTLLDAGAIDSGIATGAMTLISSITASNSSTMDFTSGITSTYKEYLFTFNNIHCNTNDQDFTFQTDTGTNTNYNITVTSAGFRPYHNEAGNSAGVGYLTGQDQAQGTGFQQITQRLGSDNDQVASGHLRIYDPSNTTFVKHFVSRFSLYEAGDFAEDDFFMGYFNTTTALTRFRFKMTSGSLGSGTIKLYGIK